MGHRGNLISSAILRAVFSDHTDDKKTVLGRILAFFSIFSITLSRYKQHVFRELRTEHWKLNEDEYRESFRSPGKNGRLESIGDLGYSGSTFFQTPNSKFLVKSLPRASEYDFFAEELLEPYHQHNIDYPASLLVRVTDFLESRYKALGNILGLTPSHHIIMENILYGKEADPAKDRWETYDLKPISYFYPERDLAGGHLASESVKDRLIDTFEDKLRITKYQCVEFVEQIYADTKLLEACNVVDYSLFLVRYPAHADLESGVSREVPHLNSRATAWRTGMQSSDGKWIYRAVLLDFFWAKHKFQAQAMTGLISSFNVISGKGHMSITTNAREYRLRFMRMIEDMIEVPGLSEST